MARRMLLIAVLVVCPVTPPLAAARDTGAHHLNSEPAARNAAHVARTIRAQEPQKRWGREDLGPHCVPSLTGTVPHDKDAYRLSTELATRIAGNVERTIKAKEPKWKLTKGGSLGHVFTQSWRSSSGSLNLEIFVCDSPEGASRELLTRGVLPVALSQELEDFGEEARYIAHPYVTWVGVRKGRLVASVWGPGMTTTRRFAQHALEQLEAQDTGNLTTACTRPRISRSLIVNLRGFGGVLAAGDAGR